jgi:lipopolysaccharide transport system ATP-binding protein
MDDGLAIRAVDLGKRFLRDGWQPHFGLKKAVEHAMRAPLRALRDVRSVAPARDRYFWALRGVSFEIPRGQVTGLVGPNGAGKSVLLKILSRVTQPTEGFAEVRGRVGAMLEGGASFHPELTARENLNLSGTLFGMNQREVSRKFARIAAFAEVEAFIDKPVKHYSSGMVLRLALAVSVHLDCDVLLIDEALASGDESFRRKCVQTIRSMAAEGRTVVFVSHDPTLVSQICHRCLYIADGRLSDEGPTAEILTRYGAHARGGSR